MSMREPKRSILWAIAEKHLPPGWTLKEMAPGRSGKFRDEDGMLIYGEADYNKRLIRCVRIVNRYTLCVLLHECGHVRMEHFKLDDADSAQCEFEAEAYAIGALRAEGLSVPQSYLDSAREYVRAHAEAEVGMEHADPLLRFCYGKEWRAHR